MAIDITALYCCLDDFCKLFADWEAHRRPCCTDGAYKRGDANFAWVYAIRT